MTTAAASYDSMGQVLAHLVRDWADEGHAIRASLYDWCRQRTAGRRRILVPGAGLGRLAWELQQQQEEEFSNCGARQGDPCIVHAVEMSWTMVAVFHAMVGQVPHKWTLYPYLNDFWTDQVTSETRFQPVRIPNVAIPTITTTTTVTSSSRLTWTVADFVALSQLPSEQASYDAIVTCFFLDTATNILDYLHAMERVLQRKGRWINVGPLHWHANARLVLTAEDLYAVFQAASQWKILEWSVDDTPLEYRSVTNNNPQGGGTTSTRYEAYRPLRFVVEKQ